MQSYPTPMKRVSCFLNHTAIFLNLDSIKFQIDNQNLYEKDMHFNIENVNIGTSKLNSQIFNIGFEN